VVNDAHAEAVDVVAVIVDKHVENVTIAKSAKANSLVMVKHRFPSFSDGADTKAKHFSLFPEIHRNARPSHVTPPMQGSYSKTD
jgi:hypothetical protein